MYMIVDFLSVIKNVQPLLQRYCMLLLGKIVCLITRTDKQRWRGDKIVGTRDSDLFSKVAKVKLSYKA